MTRRWGLWTLGLFLLAFLLTMPLRLAIGSLTDSGLTVRQVAGTIWYGRIGEMHLKNQRLGTFEVELDPFALLLGRVDMDFRRLDDPEGVLSGALISGARGGIRGASGRVAVAGLFGNLPIEALQLDELTVLFRGTECAEASGRITAIASLSLAGLAGGGELAGTARCENGRVRLLMETPDGNQTIGLLIRPSGDYRGWLTIRGAAPDIMTGLTAVGFQPAAGGMMLSVEGKL